MVAFFLREFFTFKKPANEAAPAGSVKSPVEEDNSFWARRISSLVTVMQRPLNVFKFQMA